jgi:hypothetical protein
MGCCGGRKLREGGRASGKPADRGAASGPLVEAKATAARSVGQPAASKEFLRRPPGTIRRNPHPAGRVASTVGAAAANVRGL